MSQANPNPPPEKAADGASVADISQEKACQILEDGEVNGNPLTGPQQRYFGMICSGQRPTRAENGSLVIPRDYDVHLLNAVNECPVIAAADG